MRVCGVRACMWVYGACCSWQPARAVLPATSYLLPTDPPLVDYRPALALHDCKRCFRRVTTDDAPPAFPSPCALAALEQVCSTSWMPSFKRQKRVGEEGVSAQGQAKHRHASPRTSRAILAWPRHLHGQAFPRTLIRGSMQGTGEPESYRQDALNLTKPGRIAHGLSAYSGLKNRKALPLS